MSVTIVEFVNQSTGDTVETVYHVGDDRSMWEAAGLNLHDPYMVSGEDLLREVWYALDEFNRNREYLLLYERVNPEATTVQNVLDFLNTLEEVAYDNTTARVVVTSERSEEA